MNEETSFEQDIKEGAGECFCGKAPEPTPQDVIDELRKGIEEIRKYTRVAYDQIMADLQAVHTVSKLGVDQTERFVELLDREYYLRKDETDEDLYSLQSNLSYLEGLLKETKEETSN